MTDNNNNIKKLIQIKLNSKAYHEFKAVKKTTGLTTTDVIKYSIAIFKWVIKKQKSGCEIYAIPPEGKEPGEKIELLFPI
jgi:hypothetical protein